VPSERVLRAGRVLRAMLQHESPYMIADRKHHLRVYRRSMVGAELVDWLVQCVPSQVRSRAQAVGVWQALLEEGVIVHGTRVTGSFSHFTFAKEVMFYPASVCLSVCLLPASRKKTTDRIFIKILQKIHFYRAAWNADVV